MTKAPDDGWYPAKTVFGIGHSYFVYCPVVYNNFRAFSDTVSPQWSLSILDFGSNDGIDLPVRHFLAFWIFNIGLFLFIRLCFFEKGLISRVLEILVR